MTDVTLNTNMTLSDVNATMLIFSGIIALILFACFRKAKRGRGAARTFFFAALAAFIAEFAFAGSFLHHPHPHDTLFLIFTVIAYVGIFATEFLYVVYVIKK